MKPTIKIDFVSDIACPWCAVGLGNLNQAMAELSDKVNLMKLFRLVRSMQDLKVLKF